LSKIPHLLDCFLHGRLGLTKTMCVGDSDQLDAQNYLDNPQCSIHLDLRMIVLSVYCASYGRFYRQFFSSPTYGASSYVKLNQTCLNLIFVANSVKDTVFRRSITIYVAIQVLLILRILKSQVILFEKLNITIMLLCDADCKHLHPK